METTRCPKCSKLAIRRKTGLVLTMSPPHDACEWWCKCGWRMAAPPMERPIEHDTAIAEWEYANR